MATNIPKVTVGPHAGGWLATCSTCGFAFWHVRRDVADEQAIDHQSKGHRKAGGG